MASEQSVGAIGAILQDTSHVVAIAFVVFMALIIKLVGPFILRSLDSRSAKIEDELDEAKKLKEDAQALLSAYQKHQKNALAKADEIISKAEENAKSMVDFAHKELEIAINKRIEIAMKKVENLEAVALQEVREQAVEEAMQKVLGKIEGKIDASVADTLINSSISNVGKLN
ncbi:MAG: hypothetical protein MK137_07715 [Rickettsiales bacterium]|nr:hypothetical protein [Rickettsiales bacterium]